MTDQSPSSGPPGPRAALVRHLAAAVRRDARVEPSRSDALPSARHLAERIADLTGRPVLLPDPVTVHATTEGDTVSTTTTTTDHEHDHDHGHDRAAEARPGPRAGEQWIDYGHRQGLMTSRDWSSGVLMRVAEAARHGAWPAGVSMFDVARALRRAAGNIDYLQESEGPGGGSAVREAALEEFLLGWRAANSAHGPVHRLDNGTAEEVPIDGDGQYPRHPDGSPVSGRMRSADGGRMWWRMDTKVGLGEWTDGFRVAAWDEVEEIEGVMYPVS